MPFFLPSLAETREFLVAAFRQLFGDRNAGNKRSYHGRRMTAFATGITAIHNHGASVQKDVMPHTASDDGPIDEWGYGVMRIRRKDGTPARKAEALRVYGTDTSTAEIGDTLIHKASGNRYQLNSNVTIAGVAPNNFVDADVIALTPGAATRLAAGEILEFEDPPDGIEEQARLMLDLDDDGTDKEPFGAYRKRVLDAIGIPASGGNQDDWQQWALKIPEIGAAFAYINRAGFGTVDLVVLHSATRAARIPDSGTLAEALAYVKTKAPGHFAVEDSALRMLIPIDEPVTVKILITPDGRPENAFYWDDVSFPVVVVSWNGATRHLTMTTDGDPTIPATMKAGHTICFEGVATEQDGREYKIEAIIDADTVMLEEAPQVAPAATDIIRSGGPLTKPIRDALIGHINGQRVYAARGRIPKSESTLTAESTTPVGLEIVAEGIGPANPAGRFGPWSGTLVRQQLELIAGWKGGVRKASVAFPVADVDATDFEFPNDDQIGLLSPSVVLVRRG